MILQHKIDKNNDCVDRPCRIVVFDWLDFYTMEKSRRTIMDGTENELWMCTERKAMGQSIKDTDQGTLFININ